MQVGDSLLPKARIWAATAEWAISRIRITCSIAIFRVCQLLGWWHDGIAWMHWIDYLWYGSFSDAHVRAPLLLFRWICMNVYFLHSRWATSICLFVCLLACQHFVDLSACGTMACHRINPYPWPSTSTTKKLSDVLFHNGVSIFMDWGFVHWLRDCTGQDGSLPESFARLGSCWCEIGCCQTYSKRRLGKDLCDTRCVQRQWDVSHTPDIYIYITLAFRKYLEYPEVLFLVELIQIF